MTAATMPQPMPAMPVSTAGPMSMVKIRNVGDTDFVKDYHIDMITIPAHGESFVMWEVMVYWLGNPALTDESIRSKQRTREYERLRVLYGAYENDLLWEANRPRLEVRTLDDQRIHTVVDDPEGKYVMPAQQTVAGAASYEAQIAALQRQLGALQTLVEQGQPPVGAQQPMPPIPMDAQKVAGPAIPTPPAAPPASVAGLATPGSGITNPLEQHGGFTDTTPAPPPMPPFQVDAPPEDGAPGPRVSG